MCEDVEIRMACSSARKSLLRDWLYPETSAEGQSIYVLFGSRDDGHTLVSVLSANASGRGCCENHINRGGDGEQVYLWGTAEIETPGSLLDNCKMISERVPASLQR